ncbi:sensor histidine kinase [Halovenus salina]|uniref:histidine kinase n=1 Tax=Halovenus salina TaxID=1510225 RepID=A0ABD5VWU0_9EURY
MKLLIPEGRTITELKEREQHLKVMNRFLRHNVRNQMTIIQGQGDYLASQIDDSEYQSCLEQITENATELTELTETAHELLQLTVEQSPERRPVAPGDVVKESLQQLGDQYPEAAISVDCRADALASADNRLGAVVEELVENAIVHGSDKPQVDVTVSKTDDHVEIHVADDGPGIPDDELAGIMTDQEQTQLTHGTGFGLWIVRSIVDDCGGELDYRKRDGSGSKVIVRLQQAGGEQSSEFDQSDRR